MTAIVIVITVGVFVASLVAFVISVLVPGSENTATEERLAALAIRQRSGGNPEKESLLLNSQLDDSTGKLDQLMSKLPALHEYLEQAGIKLTPSQFVMICLGCFTGGIAICLLTPVPTVLAPLVGAALTGLPIGWLLFKRKRRLALFGLQMPEALELLGRSLRAGHSLNAGFGLIASELEAPLATEFGRCFEEQKFGVPLDEAIEGMSARIPNMDLRFFATAVILQRQTGGDLGEVLDKIGHLIRERLKLLGTIQALTGEGRMSGAVLLALPPTLFLVMLKIDYDYVMRLFTDPAGRYLLGAALASQLLGALMIKKIITIKV